MFDNVADIVREGGAGVLPFLVFGILALAYLAARMFPGDHLWVRFGAFLLIFSLVTAGLFVSLRSIETGGPVPANGQSPAPLDPIASAGNLAPPSFEPIMDGTTCKLHPDLTFLVDRDGLSAAKLNLAPAEQENIRSTIEFLKQRDNGCIMIFGHYADWDAQGPANVLRGIFLKADISPRQMELIRDEDEAQFEIPVHRGVLVNVRD